MDNKLFEPFEAERPVIPDSNADYYIGYNNGLVMAQAIVPKLDVVEVVRCKDCKWWRRNVGIVDSPNGHCFSHDIDSNGYDFCSYGERKDNENP